LHLIASKPVFLKLFLLRSRFQSTSAALQKMNFFYHFEKKII